MNDTLSRLADLLDKGGFVMPPLVIGAILLWYGLGYRIVLLFWADRRDARALFEAAKAGLLQAPRGVLAHAASMGTDVSRARRVGLRYLLDELFQEHDRELSRFSVLTSGIIKAAPLAGLLGTVSGMIETFNALGDMTLVSQQGGSVAGGISEALFSTEMGLLVAVPGLLIGRLLDRRAEIVRGELTKLKDIIDAEARS